MIATSIISLLLVGLQLFHTGYSQQDLYKHVAQSLMSASIQPFSTVADGVDIGVEELRSVGRSVTRRTLSKWNGDDVTRQEETIMELLKDNPWAHFSIREGGRNTVNFSPRLGREEDIVFTETSRSPPFAPRLGRVIHFTPTFRRLTIAGQQ